MSNLINKVKEAVTGHHNTTSDNATTAGHHHGSLTQHGTTTGVGSTGLGPHDSSLGNKIDPRVDSTTGQSTSSGMTGTGHHSTTGHNLSGTHGNTGVTGVGPHSSSLANKADPRVDSDLDGSRKMGAASTTHHGTTGTGLTGTHHNTTGTGVTGTHGNTGVSGAGPHDSKLANKMDPRVDSDLDGSRNMGAAGTTGIRHGQSGVGHTSGSGITGSHTGTHSHHTSGPHSTETANKLDPRIGGGIGHSGHHDHHNTSGISGTGLGSSTTGTHSGHHTGSNLTGTGSNMPGTGNAPNTAGPHKSDLLNKLDPRVDSDLDGSKTMGGNKTHA